MKTFQDLEKITTDLSKGKFCENAIAEFRMSEMYRQAQAGEAYYNKHNLTIEAYQKTLTTISGARVADRISANYKLKTLFFRRLVSQQIQYVLGNGLVLENPDNKKKLGKDFDFQLMTCAKRAMSSGVAFGFWNVDHLEVFGFADTPNMAGFCPLYDESTSKLRAGIRFWFRYVDDEEILRMTLYEEDGFTEYVSNNKKISILEEKRAYVKTIKQLADGTIEDEIDSNYGTLPIIPMYANDSHESELVGIRECIDCYDLVKSGLANNIDDASEIYWILKNTGGMDDIDMAQFLQRLKNVHVASMDDTEIESQTMQVPTDARKTMLELLKKDIYDDFQALNVETLSASAKTTQEIQASYQAQDNKCADFEYFMIDFVQGILALAEIDDTPTFVWNRVVNQAEQTQMVLSAQNFIPADILIKHLPFLTPEEADLAIKEQDSAEYDTFNADDTEEDEEGAEEAETDTEDDETTNAMEQVNALLDELMSALEG